MRILKYIFLFLIFFGCKERDFTNPYDPFNSLTSNIGIIYEGTETNILRIDNKTINPKSFGRYEIYLSKSAGFVPSKDNLTGIITKYDSTGILLENLDENESYYIRLKFIDVLEREKLSDELHILTRNLAPPKPQIASNSEVELNKITVRWRRADIKDFLKYELYFSTLKDFPLSQVNLYRTITNVNDTVLVFQNLKPNTDYHFCLRMYDRGNLYTDSDYKTFKTENDLPTAVILEDVYNPTQSSLDLKWTKNADEDFLKYEIHYSTNPNFTITAQTLVKSITNQNSTFITIDALSASRRYYFKIRVVDKGGLFNDSNERDGTTSEPSGEDVPKPVTISQPTEITQTSMRLSWSQYPDLDFKQYELHYSTTPNFILTSSTLYFAPLTNRNTISIPVQLLNPNTKYYFRVRIVNNKDKFSDSQEVSATTLP